MKKRNSLDRERITANIWRYNNELTTSEMAEKFGCGESTIRLLRREHGIISTVPQKRPNRAIPETMWEGVSLHLITVPFNDFGKEVSNLCE
ncbi:hypothetical protein [Neptunomonas sp.]|uniref:hypothetical protein n=1 Tax=Neptunomonas TaxID=75687 RepID=UPI0035187C5A